MKNFKKLFVLFLMGSAALSFSCSKNATDSSGNPNNPTITVSPSSDVTAAAGTSVTFTVTGNSNSTSNSAISELKIAITTPGGGIGAGGFDSTAFTSSSKSLGSGKMFTYMVPTSAKSGDIYTVTFTLTDKNSNTASATRNITVTGGSGSINSYSAVLLAAPAGNNLSKTFYSSSNNTTYTLSDANASATIQKSIDLGYYELKADGGHLVAPSSYPSSVYNLGSWTNKNGTTFYLTGMTSSDFAGVSDDTKITAAAGSGTTDAASIAKGQVYYFKTDANSTSGVKQGLIYVSDLQIYPSVPYYASKVTIQVKVQK